MSTHFVLIADFAFKTADVVGVHGKRATAEGQAKAMPEKYGDGSRPVIVTATTLARQFAKWDVRA